MFERRFGIAAYDYWWGYSKAQIELMIADQPFVSYKRKKKVTKASLDKMYDEWEKKKNERGGFVGKKIDLNNFFNAGGGITGAERQSQDT